MKTEREIRALIALMTKSLQQDADCPGCKNCFAVHVGLAYLKWVVDGDGGLDRQIETMAKQVAEIG